MEDGNTCRTKYEVLDKGVNHGKEDDDNFTNIGAM